MNHVQPEADDATPDVGSPDPEWEDQIARLLRRPENLRSVYQPIVDLRSGDCVGYEALTRVAEWPARSPQPWFQAASRTGLAAQFEAAALVSSLRGRADLPQGRFLTVNVSPSCLGHPLVTEVLLQQEDLRGLVAELTEVSSVIGEGTNAEVFAGLRERGLLVAVDVTEAGLPDLQHVIAVRPDLVKLDRVLVKDVHSDMARDRLVRLVVGLAEEVGAAVLAEGVEALEDARLLQLLGVRMAQGWLFGRARPGFLPPSEEVASWLQATWEENVTLLRVGRLAVPIGRVGDGVGEGMASDAWLADLDEDGRLLNVVGGPDAVTLPARSLLKVRASADLRAAAGRVVTAGPARRPYGVVAVVDDDSRFVGLVDADILLREVLGGGQREDVPTS